MDRFIVIAIIAPKIAKPNLKSNMDRFIEVDSDEVLEGIELFKIQYGQIYSEIITRARTNIAHLKSNMDRFIDEPAAAPASAAKHLKSNMDRFIVSA